MKRVLILLLLLTGCHESRRGRLNPDRVPKNVILMIGDGMGVSQITLARLLHGKLALDEFPVTGLMTTHSADGWVTDSASAATAMSTGIKTYNGAIAVDVNKKPIRTILEDAEARGLTTVLITSSKITHATPAAFAAHVVSRGMEEEIAKQYLDSGVDYLIGGGRKFFPEDLKKKFAARSIHLQLHAEGHVPYVIDEGRPFLPEAVRSVFNWVIDNPKGFFMMIEGARIDHACHASDAASAVAEMMDFDRAVREVLRFAKEDGSTLVIVTADHATGGMAISEKVELYRDRFKRVRGSAEAMAAKVREGHELKDVLADWANVTDLTREEELLFDSTKGKYDPASVIGEIVSKRLGVTFIPFAYRRVPPNRTHGHDGAMVPVYAYGPGMGRFSGTIDNTDIADNIRLLTGWSD